MKQFIASFRQSAFIHFFTISLLTFTFILSGSEIQAQTSTKISLPYFSVQIVNRVVNLSWQTNQEDGVSHFERRINELSSSFSSLSDSGEVQIIEGQDTLTFDFRKKWATQKDTSSAVLNSTLS